MDTWIRAQAVGQRNSSQPHSMAKWCHYQCCTEALEEGQSSSSRSTGCCSWSDDELWCGARRICSDSAHRARALEHSVNHWVEACRGASIRQFVHVHTHNSQSPDCNPPHHWGTNHHSELYGRADAVWGVWLWPLLNCFCHCVSVWRTARVLPFWADEDEGSSPLMSWTATNVYVSSNEKEAHWFKSKFCW